MLAHCDVRTILAALFTSPFIPMSDPTATDKPGQLDLSSLRLMPDGEALARKRQSKSSVTTRTQAEIAAVVVMIAGAAAVETFSRRTR